MSRRGNSWSSLGRLGAVRRCAIIVRHEGRCAWCFVPLAPESGEIDGVMHKAAEIDHVIPRRHGGRDVASNLVPCCSSCNLDRPEGARVPIGVLSEPLDLGAGRQLALAWYEWALARFRDNAERKRRKRRAAPRGGGNRAERAALRAEGGDTSWPFEMAS